MTNIFFLAGSNQFATRLVYQVHALLGLGVDVWLAWPHAQTGCSMHHKATLHYAVHKINALYSLSSL